MKKQSIEILYAVAAFGEEAYVWIGSLEPLRELIELEAIVQCKHGNWRATEYGHALLDMMETGVLPREPC